MRGKWCRYRSHSLRRRLWSAGRAERPLWTSDPLLLCCVNVTLSLCLRLSKIFFFFFFLMLFRFAWFWRRNFLFTYVFKQKIKSKNNLGPGWVVVQVQSGNWGKIMVPPACIGLGRNSLEFFYSRNKIPIMFSQIEVSGLQKKYI